MSAPYAIAVGLLALGLATALAQRNLVRKLVGMTVFQTAIILFFLMLSVKRGADLPIVPHGVIAAPGFMNPLPHALMLTAIVVMVATSGVAFAILIRLYQRYGTLEEDRIDAAIAREGDAGD
jgi:multicomponent Na+:H+ antiporter subunit C